MTYIPNLVEAGPLMADGSKFIHQYLEEQGWTRVHQGKVRNTYAHSNYPNCLLVVATDRLSIFDFVLPVEVRRKGECLTAITHFILNQVLADVPNQLAGFWPEELDRSLQSRCLFVRKLKMQPYELIFRAHLGGSVWKAYEKDGIVAGQPMPPGLTKWQKLDVPIFTPSTKAEVGHDVNITAEEYFQSMGGFGKVTVRKLGMAYERVYSFARERGILILDTKFEVGEPFALADEIFTPDSSRFTTVEDYDLAMKEKRDPIFYDKELVRVWGRSFVTSLNDNSNQPIVGLNNLDPANPSHPVYVGNALYHHIPNSVIAETKERYEQLFRMLVGSSLDEYQQTQMGVAN